MEIIDRVSRTLGLSEKDGKKEVEMSTKEELPNAEPEQKESPIQPPPENLSGRKVVDFNSAISARDNLMSNNNTAKPMVKSKITTVRPKNFDDDAKVIADCLREDVPVIINLEDTNPEHARRIIDFALGTTYAIDGDVQMVNKDVFVCTPKSVMVIANREEPKQEKDFSWLTRKM
ncbi:MAG: cell division protein SepF [Quinella sp. 3Q1]|nr:cell division protein SepF [Quinella sp. 3Q1]MBR6887583.1 cell division protein SepF [Selenomonadaceae bacterium]